MDKILKFFETITPALVKFAIALFKLHDGDADAAVRDIDDRRAEIEARRIENDEAILRKHRDDTPTER